MDDVVVVGAGPAGSATALLLARSGIGVRIVERARFPRRKVCGEYLNGGAVAALERLGMLPAVRALAAPLRGVRLFPAHTPAVTLPFAAPALACTREILDALLLDAAVAAGATLERGRVDDLLFERGRCTGVVLRAGDGAQAARRARIVVGADGIGSAVARKLGVVRAAGSGRFAVGGHYAGLGGLDGHVEMYLGGGAYLALNPLAGERTNVMSVVSRERLATWSGDIEAGMWAGAARLAGVARSFDDVRRIGARVSIGPLSHRVRLPTAPGAILVGDAAGFLDPFTGQGVALALGGAERGAAAILAALGGPGREAAAFAAYARWRAGDLAWRRRLTAAVTHVLAVAPLARRVSTRLARFPEAGASLLESLGGTAPPQRAFRPAVLGRLLA